MGNYDTDIIEMCLVLKKTFVWYFGGLLTKVAAIKIVLGYRVDPIAHPKVL